MTPGYGAVFNSVANLYNLSNYFGFGFGFIDYDTVTETALERFSTECRKTKTRVITLANHKGHRYKSSEPIKTRSNYMWLTQSAGKRVRVNHDWFWFYS